MKKQVLKLSLLIWVFHLAFLPRGFGQVPGTVTIATWNIKGFDPIPASRVERISGVIRRTPHLIVLTEVNPEAVAGQIASNLSSQGLPYEATPVPAQNPTLIQHISILHRPGVVVSNVRLIDGSDLAEEDRSRKAVTAQITMRKFDFVLVGVHLKSGRENANREQRRRQCEAIANFIREASNGTEKDILIVGDYKMIPGDDQVDFTALNPDSLLRFLSSESLSGQISHFSQCNPDQGHLLDGFAISANQTSEYVNNSIRIRSFGSLGFNCSSFTQGVSDHLPVVAKFHTKNDGD